MDTNPYQSPATPIDPAVGQDLPLRVEGRSLVVPTDTVLPLVCIRTNQPVSEADMVRASLFWCSPWVAILALGGLLVIPGLLLFGKRIKITYGLAPELRRRHRVWRTVKVTAFLTGLAIPTLALATVAGIFAISPSTVLDIGTAVIGKVTMIAIVVGSGCMFVSIFIGNKPLGAVKHEQGMFWVKGCCDEYLARIEAEAVSGDLPVAEPMTNG